jgi:GNAT superfamily N-acetyltransferase
VVYVHHSQAIDVVMKIIHAQQRHIRHVARLISACTQAMRANGIYQWDEIYPNEEIIAEDVKSHSLYVLVDGEVCIAAITLNQKQDPAYEKVQWLGGEPVLVAHRLCVSPANQGKGSGSGLMDFAEEHAKQNAYASIRLDAYTGNLAAVRLYERRGYRNAGQVYFPRRTLPFFCFEKIIATIGSPQ